jgi:hypothetical protein
VGPRVKPEDVNHNSLLLRESVVEAGAGEAQAREVGLVRVGRRSLSHLAVGFGLLVVVVMVVRLMIAHGVLR